MDFLRQDSFLSTFLSFENWGPVWWGTTSNLPVIIYVVRSKLFSSWVCLANMVFPIIKAHLHLQVILHCSSLCKTICFTKSFASLLNHFLAVVQQEVPFRLIGLVASTTQCLCRKVIKCDSNELKQRPALVTAVLRIWRNSRKLWLCCSMIWSHLFQTFCGFHISSI